ncbi:MAG: LbtU family siderophore porin [Gammaproteobacteria bacterium]|nr:LbtU family siderophore porin [Gammaproteobacteria bacterium]
MRFKGVVLWGVLVLSAFITLPVSANQDMEEMMQMIEALKARVEQLELQLAQQSRKVEQVAAASGHAQPEHVQAMNRRLVKLEQAKKSNSRYGGVDFHGVVEVEAMSGDDHTGMDGSDVTLATVELGFDFSAFNDWVIASFATSYEEDGSDKWEVDNAFFTIGNTEKYPLYLSAGRMYVPFGNFETNLVSDTLALEIGETRETAIQLGFEMDDWYGSAYVFNGDVDESGDDEVENYGFNLGYGMEGEDSSLGVGLSWTNSLSDSDGIEDTVPTPIQDYVSGYGVHGVYRTGPWSFMGEYITATEDFLAGELAWKTGGAKPSAYNMEVGYDFEAFGGRESNVAFAMQGTDEAVALGLPEKKWLAGFSTTLYENTSLAVEYVNADDYSVSDGGTGKDGNAVTLQVAVEF